MIASSEGYLKNLCKNCELCCRYTKNKSTSSTTGYSVYAFFFDWPDNNVLFLGAPIVTASSKVCAPSSAATNTDTPAHAVYGKVGGCKLVFYQTIPRIES